MKEVRFAFYLAEFQWRNIFNKDKKLHFYDDAISWWTWLFNWFTPGYSHVEVWIQSLYFPSHNPDEAITIFETSDLPGTHFGFCYTSTMRGDENGTVRRAAQDVFIHPNRWHYLEFEVTDESFAEAKAWADERVRKNKGYAMKDIRRFFMPLWLLKKLKWDDPDREICSEHGEGWATRLRGPWPGIIIPGWRVLLHKILIRSPRRLWRDLVRRHSVPTYSLATGLMVYDSKRKKVE